MRTVRINQVEFDSTKQVRETEDAIIVPTIFTRESILPFKDGRGYRSAKELQDAAWTLDGSWIVAYQHTKDVFVTNRADIRGRAENPRFCSKINGIIGDTKFLKARCDASFLENVRNGLLKDVSVAYFADDIFTSGRFGDEAYDFVQQNFMFGHVAAGVAEGRCPSPFCGMSVDSLFAHGDPEETANFIHIPIRDKGLFVQGMDRTITLSADEGIEAVIGKLKSDPEGKTHIQKYMFAKAKGWTMEKAQSWVKEHKDSVEAMSLEEIKTKIRDLEGQRRAIMERLYPKTQLTEEEQRKLGEELTVLDAEMKAFTEFLTEKLGETSDNPAEAENDSTESLDPVAVLARSRELLKSR